MSFCVGNDFDMLTLYPVFLKIRDEVSCLGSARSA